jgi:hypothetical protein
MIVGVVGGVSEHRGSNAELMAATAGPVGDWRQPTARRCSQTRWWLRKLSPTPLLDSRIRAPVCSRMKALWDSRVGGRRCGGTARVYGGWRAEGTWSKAEREMGRKQWPLLLNEDMEREVKACGTWGGARKTLGDRSEPWAR